MFNKHLNQTKKVHPQQHLYLSLARNASEIAEAQRLRYKVFAEEMGAEVSGTDGLDIDGFDEFCDHLLVRESGTHQVVGTYRILSPHKADEAGGHYSAGEFDLSRISHLFDRTVELGRACVHKDYRNGGHYHHAMGGLGQLHAALQLRIHDWLR
jgi:putative hemolysin